MRAGSSGRRYDGEPSGDGRCLQAVVPGDEHGLISEPQRAREMDGVVAAEVVLGRELARSASQRVIDPDGERGGVKRLEVCDRCAVPDRRQATCSTRGRQCRPRLRVGQNADSHPMTGVPQPHSEIGPRLLDEKLDQR